MNHYRAKGPSGALTILATLALTACAHHAEPRWLVRAFPGAYPEVVYFVPTNERAIALTIDDGVDPATTPLILEVLERHGATATFFILSDSIPGREELVTRIVAEGHEIGHHMTRDEVTVSLSADQLTEEFHEAADILDEFAPVVWFRPGSGRYNDQVLELSRERGYRIALASVPPLDTLIANPKRLAGYLAWMVQPGSVVVLHDAGDRGLVSIETLEMLLPKFHENGFSVMSLGALDALATVNE